MNKNTHGDCGTARPISGAVSSPKDGGNQARPIANSVAYKPKPTSVGKIKGAITGPK